VTVAPVHRWTARDGVELAYRELGTGRPLLLLHGFFTTGSHAWLHSGHAELLASRGHRVLMADLRAHGDSGKPHDPAAYPPDVLADDGFELVERLGLTDYDLAGYSLGARTVLRMLARGATPRRAVVGGAGFEQLLDPRDRGKRFRRVLEGLGTHEWGSPDWLAEGFLRKVNGDPVALLQLLETPEPTSREQLAAIQVPTLVIEGNQDDPESGRRLAGTLADGRAVVVPGDHVSASGAPELVAAMADFLD
jgi:pimeloyl-ACP methyl ester carboxylesterase